MTLSQFKKLVIEKLGDSFSALPPADRSEIIDLIKQHHKWGFGVVPSSTLLLKEINSIR